MRKEAEGIERALGMKAWRMRRGGLKPGVREKLPDRMAAALAEWRASSRNLAPVEDCEGEGISSLCEFVQVLRCEGADIL